MYIYSICIWFPIYLHGFLCNATFASAIIAWVWVRVSLQAIQGCCGYFEGICFFFGWEGELVWVGVIGK